MADQFDVWMEFCESLRPELDSISFYPESSLPYSKSSLMEMLAGIYHETKDAAGISILAESIAVNVGYLGRFTNAVTERYLTRTGRMASGLVNLDTNDPVAFGQYMESIATEDSQKDMQLLLGFASTLVTFCKVTGFNLDDMIAWNRLIGIESTNAVKAYCEETKQ